MVKREPNAVAVLAAAILPIIGALSLRSATIAAVMLAAEVVAYWWWINQPRLVAWRTALIGFGALVLAGSVWLWGGQHLDRALTTGLRVLALALPSAWLSVRLQPSSMGDALGQTLHLPPRMVVGAAAALNQTTSMVQRWQAIRRARRSRGYGPGGGPLYRMRELAATLFALLVSAMRGAHRLSIAMDARGFAQATSRPWMYPSEFRAGDWYLLATAVGFAVLPWVARSLL